MAEKSDVFCPIPRGPKTFVWAASITVEPPLTLEQTTHPSVRIQSKYSGLLSGPRRGRDRFRRTGTIRFGGRPRNGSFPANRNYPFRRQAPLLTAHSGVMAANHNHLGFKLEGQRPTRDAAMASEAGLFFV